MYKYVEIIGKDIECSFLEKHCTMNGRQVARIDTTFYTKTREILLLDEEDAVIATIHVPVQAMVIISYVKEEDICG